MLILTLEKLSPVFAILPRRPRFPFPKRLMPFSTVETCSGLGLDDVETGYHLRIDLYALIKCFSSLSQWFTRGYLLFVV